MASLNHLLNNSLWLVVKRWIFSSKYVTLIWSFFVNKLFFLFLWTYKGRNLSSYHFWRVIGLYYSCCMDWSPQLFSIAFIQLYTKTSSIIVVFLFDCFWPFFFFLNMILFLNCYFQSDNGWILRVNYPVNYLHKFA